MDRAARPPSRRQMSPPRQDGGVGVEGAAKVRYPASSNGSGHGLEIGETR